MRLLTASSESVRLDSALKLGRLGDIRAVESLAEVLAGDASPKVRDAAARALGTIGSPKALPALHQAMHDENDFVRHSAEFAVDVIRSR